MGRYPKRRTCKHCGKQMGTGEYVEIRVLDHIPEPMGRFTSWRTETLTTEYICPTCAIGAVDRINDYEGATA